MPKTTRSDEEVDVVREKIIKSAFDILVKHGYDSLSMAKVGSKMKMTAANIYNYFRNKDELLLVIYKKAHLILYDKLISAIAPFERPQDKYRAFCYVFFDFGFNNVNIYDALFNRRIRQYSDYIGTPLEAVAYDEYSSSLKTWFLSVQITKEYRESIPNLPYVDPELITLQIFCMTHGIISLNNSGFLKEITSGREEIIRKMLEFTIKFGSEIDFN